MANNELSGPVVTAALACWLASLPDRRFTYRIVFIPETIGSITYLNRHLDHLKAKVVAGFNVTCVGDDRCHSFLPSRDGTTLSDRIGRHVLKHIEPDFREYSWLDRGSDERQYCAPGVDLPIATLMRSKYGTFPEYHTSLDDLDFVTPSGLAGGFGALRQALTILERDLRPITTVLCEPQLGKRGLYPTLSTRDTRTEVSAMMDLLSMADGSLTLFEIAEKIGRPFAELLPIVEALRSGGVMRIEELDTST